MKKKIIPILLIAILLINIIPVKKTQAVGEGAFLRVVGGSTGERVLLGIGEKAGVKFASKKAQQEAVERWNLELYQKIQEAEKYGRQHEADQLKALNLKLREPGDLQVIEGGKNAGKGFGKALISGALFLTGLDIILDTISSIESSVETEKALEIMFEYQKGIEEGEIHTSYGSYTFWMDSTLNHNGKKTFYFGIPGYKDFSYQIAYVAPDGIAVGELLTVSASTTSIYFYVQGHYQNSGVKYISSSFTLPGIDIFLQKHGEELNQDFSKGMWMPNVSNIPSVPSVPWVSPWRDNPDTNKPVIPDEVPIEVPLSDPDIYSPGEPWNDPMPTYDPVPGDHPDKDYIPGIPVNPSPTPGTEPGADPGPNLTPKPGKDVIPTPGPMPEPSPEPLPGDGDTPGEDTPNKKPGDTQNRWGKLVTNKFPFSLPWDIAGMIGALMADPKRPSIEVDLNPNFLGKTVNIEFKHDFKWMDDFIGFTRIFILIGFSIFLITSTRRLLGGGQ